MGRKKGYFDQLEAAVTRLQKRGVGEPAVAVCSSDTFRPLLSWLDEKVSIPFESIDYLPQAPSGATPFGQFRFGLLKNTDIPVLAVEGRLPVSEGFSAAEATYLVRLAGLLGAKTVFPISTGIGLNPAFHGGDVMLVEDHINCTGTDPMRGLDDERAGPKVLDMTEAYHLDLLGMAEELGIELRIKSHRGVLLSVAGPTLPTRSEYRLYRNMGADALEGSSLALETTAARAAGMRAIGLVVLVDVEHPDFLGPVTVEQIVAVENTRQAIVGRLVETFIRRIH